MRNKIFTIVWLSLSIFLFVTIPAYNQFEATPVEKSDQKIIYQGKTYYFHTVKQGQTLYSICKAYGVTQDDIASANPGITINPLSIGLALKIPVREAITTQPAETNAKSDYSDNDFIYHTVQSKENTFFLHLKYNVPLEEIYKYNPGSEGGIQIGQVVKIPKKHLYEKSYSQPGVTRERIIRYVVKQGDTLYRIAETYDLTIEDLLNANEELRWGLKEGQIITIPVSPDFAAVPFEVTDTVFMVTSHPKLSFYQCDSIATLKRMPPVIKVALLLPFYARENFFSETIPEADTLSEFNRIKSKVFKGRVAAELYEGMLLALDSLKNTGHNVSLFVYDTEADTSKLKKILKDLDIIEPDLIIGPYANENVRMVSVYSFERKIPFVPPLAYGDSNLLDNPFLFQVIPSEMILYKQYAEYLSALKNENIIFITKKNPLYHEEASVFKNMLLDQLSSKPGLEPVSFNEIVIDDSLQIHISEILRHDSVMNNVVVFSTYEPDVINVLSRLHFLLRDYPIRVFGFPAWQKFDNLRIDVVHELQVTLYSPFYIDYTENPVKLFVQKCRNELHYEPYKTTSKGNGINYTYLGYDLTMYFIQALNYYEENMCDCIGYYNNPLLLSNYYFMRNFPQEGFINTGMSLVTYKKDYTVKKLRAARYE